MPVPSRCTGRLVHHSRMSAFHLWTPPSGDSLTPSLWHVDAVGGRPPHHPLLPFTGETKLRPGIRRSGSNLIEAIPYQNFPGGHSQKLRQHHTRASVPCRTTKSEPRRGGGVGAQTGRLADGGSYPAA